MESKKKSDEILRQSDSHKPLMRSNFIAMAFAGLMIIVGFLLMLGGATTEAEFNPDIFSSRRIVIGPALAFLGFVAMAFAIIIRPTDKK